MPNKSSEKIQRYLGTLDLKMAANERLECHQLLSEDLDN